MLRNVPGVPTIRLAIYGVILPICTFMFALGLGVFFLTRLWGHVDPGLLVLLVVMGWPIPASIAILAGLVVAIPLAIILGFPSEDERWI